MSEPTAQLSTGSATTVGRVAGAGVVGRFTPDEARLREMVAAANERAERLALRLVAAERAIKSGQSSTVVLAILGGSDE